MCGKAIVGLTAVFVAGMLSAAEAASSRFALDLHYESLGEAFSSDEGTEVWGVSPCWTALTTILKIDSDGDGLPDVWEEFYGLDSKRQNASDDPDGDGWTNIEEYNAGTHPLVADNLAAMSSISLAHTVDTGGHDAIGSGDVPLDEVWAISLLFALDTAGLAPDSDDDGLPDWYERLYGFNCLVADAHLDPDGDGRTTLQEYNAGTNPLITDDWTKTSAASDYPFATDTRVYYVGGNTDFGEIFAVIRVSEGFVCDTGGLYYDWDGDGIPNWWEKRFARDGSKTGLVASDDDDKDGFDNYGEFVAYTDPTDAKSRFAIGLEPIKVEPVKVQQTPFKLMAFSAFAAYAAVPRFKLVWQSVKGRTYGVFACADLAKGWDASPVATVEGTGEKVEYVPSCGGAAMYFKVSVKLSENNQGRGG